MFNILNVSSMSELESSEREREKHNYCNESNCWKVSAFSLTGKITISVDNGKENMVCDNLQSLHFRLLLLLLLLLLLIADGDGLESFVLKCNCLIAMKYTYRSSNAFTNHHVCYTILLYTKRLTKRPTTTTQWKKKGVAKLSWIVFCVSCSMQLKMHTNRKDHFRVLLFSNSTNGNPSLWFSYSIVNSSFFFVINANECR